MKKYSLKNITFKEKVFWLRRFWFPIFILVILPISVSLLSGQGLKITERQKIVDKSPFTRAIYELIPNHQVATYVIVGLIAFIVTFALVRKYLSSEIFNDNQSVYLENCFCRLWIASNILGYKKLSMIGVALPLQFKLIVNGGTFSEFLTSTETTHYEKFDGEVIVERFNEREWDNKILNILICDTYDIAIDKLDTIYMSYPIIKISSNKIGNGIRYDNLKLVKKVREQTFSLLDDCEELNLFLTTNPLNTKRIIEDSFSGSDRLGCKKIQVIQMDSVSHIYKKSYPIFDRTNNRQ